MGDQISDRAGTNGNGHRSRVVITGGAGFVGTNLAQRLLSAGNPVTILDTLTRPGVEGNAAWLLTEYGDLVDVRVADVCDHSAVRRAIQGSDMVFHLAAQVAMTSSIQDPRQDFRVNLDGTLTLLDEMRAMQRPPGLLFTSTNKVYGRLEDLALRETELRYEPADEGLRRSGISETQRLDLCSPYGCSKGGADQYVLDHSRSFGLDTIVFRMGCIYGQHQLGTEDQGWVAHFLLRALKEEPLDVFGDGKQVRDLLHVDDLVDAMLLAYQERKDLKGRAFNIGGGPENALSLLEVTKEIEAIVGRDIDLRFHEPRQGDQRYYASDFSALNEATGWRPRIGPAEGLRSLYRWLRDHCLEAEPEAAGAH